MAGYIDIDVIGEREAAADIHDIGERGLDLRPALRRVRDMLQSGLRKNFASRGAYLGSWAPLAASTGERKGNSEVLVATGALKDSLAGGRGRKTSVTRSKVEVGTKLWYAHFAHVGTDHSPARPIVGTTDGGVRAAIWLLERYMARGGLL